MTVLLQVSDPHFGTERAPVMTALRQLVQQQQPDLLLLSGDITQRATRAQFAAARAFIDSLQVPHMLAIPGNHDIPLINLAARLCRPYARYRASFGTALEGEYENADVLVLTLNTTRRYRHIDGELSAKQIERVAARLRQATANCWRIVVTHQPLAVPHAQDAKDLLHGHEKALQCWSDAGADVVMGGHIHLPYVLAMHQSIPALPGPLWVVQAGTALSSRVRVGAPNSVNLLRIATPASAPRQLRVERWDYSDDGQCFACVDVEQLQAPQAQ
jgi:3',5'-cyclic AMP phosphodiesterase CpdA